MSWRLELLVSMLWGDVNKHLYRPALSARAPTKAHCSEPTSLLGLLMEHEEGVMYGVWGTPRDPHHWKVLL